MVVLVSSKTRSQVVGRGKPGSGSGRNVRLLKSVLCHGRKMDYKKIKEKDTKGYLSEAWAMSSIITGRHGTAQGFKVSSLPPSLSVQSTQYKK